MMKRPFSTATATAGVFARREQFGWKEVFLQNWNNRSWLVTNLRQSMSQSQVMLKVHQNYRQHGLWYWAFFANAVTTFWISKKLSNE